MDIIKNENKRKLCTTSFRSFEINVRWKFLLKIINESSKTHKKNKFKEYQLPSKLKLVVNFLTNPKDLRHLMMPNFEIYKIMENY